MFVFRALFTALGMTLAAVSVQAQDQMAVPAPIGPVSRYPAASLGLTLGYGAPYGWGVDYSRMVAPKTDVNAGVGFTISGAKIGVGTRYYFTPERKVSAFVGGNLVYSTGLNNITVTSNRTNGGPVYPSGNGNSAVVNFKSAGLMHLRGGARWQPTRRFAMLGALGYGIVLGGDAVEYVSGSVSQDVRTAIDIFSPGGVEVSVGVAFGLGG